MSERVRWFRTTKGETCILTSAHTKELMKVPSFSHIQPTFPKLFIESQTPTDRLYTAVADEQLQLYVPMLLTLFE